MSYNYDELDAYILLQLTENPDMAYSDIAKSYGCSVGIIHVRLDKMRKAGVIQKAKIQLNHDLLGYELECFIGITLSTAKAYHRVLDELRTIPEILEAYYTTGRYNIFTKLRVKNLNYLHNILTTQIQNIPDVISTDTIISMETPIHRQLNLYEQFNREKEGNLPSGSDTSQVASFEPKPMKRRRRNKFNAEYLDAITGTNGADGQGMLDDETLAVSND